MDIDNSVTQGVLYHQMHKVSKTEGENILIKLRNKYGDHSFIDKLEDINNNK